MGLKEISESIAAVRESIGHCGGPSCEAHFDILLSQIAEELRRAHRGAGSAQALAGLLEREAA